MSSEKTVQDTELTKEEGKAQIRLYEKDILKGLLAAATFKSDTENTHKIEIARNGMVLFSFHVRPLSEDEYSDCKEKYTKYVRNKNFGGIKVPEDTDTVKYRSALLYQATISEDRAKVWDNQEAWRALNIITGIDMIDAVLMAGEKDAALDLIDRISGYTGAMEDVAKN